MLRAGVYAFHSCGRLLLSPVTSGVPHLLASSSSHNANVFTGLAVRSIGSAMQNILDAASPCGCGAARRPCCSYVSTYTRCANTPRGVQARHRSTSHVGCSVHRSLDWCALCPCSQLSASMYRGLCGRCPQQRFQRDGRSALLARLRWHTGNVTSSRGGYDRMPAQAGSSKFTAAPKPPQASTNAYLYAETDELAELIQEFTRLPASEQRAILQDLKKRSAKR